MLSREVLFLTVMDGETIEIQDMGLTETNKKILRAVIDRGYDMSVFLAWMAETYVYNVAAPDWRRMSGTRNGVYVSLLVNSADGNDWAEFVNELIDGDESPIEKAFLAWINGTLPVERFKQKWPRFYHAARNRLQTVIAEA